MGTNKFQGNWSLYTTAFSKLPLYVYYNPLVPDSVLQTEADLLEVIRDEGPFEGVLGYSGGAALAAQLIIKDCEANPLALPHERPFRFAVFINGASPLRVFTMDEVNGVDGRAEVNDGVMTAMAEEAAEMFLRPSALRKKAGVEEEDQPDANFMAKALATFKGVVLSDGTPAFTDGVHGLSRYNPLEEGGVLVDIPTLHIRCVNETRHNGLHLYEMCEPSQAVEFHHTHGHDFPRGRVEMKRIAEMIREIAERS